MVYIIIIFGILIGSFLNVCIYRLPKNENIAFKAKYCPKYKINLKWYYHIPLFSYIPLKNKCRYCNSRLSDNYPIIESLNTIIYLILFYYFNFSIDFIFYAIISSVLIVIFFIDLEHMIIPDILIIFIFIISVLHKLLDYFLYNISFNIMKSLLGMLIAGSLFFLIVLLSDGGMGGGDVTLIGVLGFVLGIKWILVTIFLSFIFGAVVSIVLLMTKIKGRKDPIPFGPFIILGFFITLLYGEYLINFYLNLFI